MSYALQWRRGTTAEHSTFIGLAGEVTVDISKYTLVIHDAVTAGGFALQPALVSGASIKTVNNISLLGSGNITISGGETISSFLLMGA